MWCEFLLVRQINLGNVLSNLSWLRIRQIPECDYGELIIDVAVDRGLESLPRAIVMYATVSRSLVDEPAKTIIALVRLSIFQFDRSPHQVEAGMLQQSIGV